MHKYTQIPKELLEEIEYQNGQLYWKRNNGKRKMSKAIGSFGGNGYFIFGFTLGGEKKYYSVHRVVWALFNKGMVQGEIDHINGIKIDNRIENLRLATSLQNKGNSKKAKNCSSKYKGVVWHKYSKSWRSGIVIDGKYNCLGYFKDEKQAARKYDYAAILRFGNFAKPNFKTNL